jgi:hypothetical protein
MRNWAYGITLSLYMIITNTLIMQAKFELEIYMHAMFLQYLNLVGIGHIKANPIYPSCQFSLCTQFDIHETGLHAYLSIKNHHFLTTACT